MTNCHLTLSVVLAAFMGWALIAQPAWGTTQDEELASQTFTVKHMTCAACPITVKRAMSRIDGVRRVNVDFGAKTVTAIYDPALTDAEAIAESSALVGFPATAIRKASP